ncbi:SMI1/KNR4 family protein [Baekduia sp. Peel2402]|uniref:SMI1/KNR4 family protein n=1 Tax=Baekduia sp. Peel2402 TaxID=3458296 RepID=UPI00403EF6A6
MFLDDNLLQALEQSWSDAGAQYLGAMRTGLSDVEIDALDARLGFALPEEVRRWYRWHDGSNEYYITSLRMMTPLADDVDQTLMLEDEDEDEDQAWPRGWLRTMSDQPFVAFDCRGAKDDPVPVWHYHLGFEVPTRPVFASIGDMVAYWTGLVTERTLTWSAETGWRLAPSAAPDVVARLGGVPTDG